MYIYGKNVAKEYLTNKEKIKKIYLANNFNDVDILNRIKNMKVNYLDKFELDKLVKGNHQGIISSILVLLLFKYKNPINASNPVDFLYVIISVDLLE